MPDRDAKTQPQDKDGMLLQLIISLDGSLLTSKHYVIDLICISFAILSALHGESKGGVNFCGRAERIRWRLQ